MRSVVLGAVLFVFGAFLNGCGTTMYAKVNAYGVHAITPYGIISLGAINYERVADPDKPKEP